MTENDISPKLAIIYGNYDYAITYLIEGDQLFPNEQGYEKYKRFIHVLHILRNLEIKTLGSIIKNLARFSINGRPSKVRG